MQGLLENSFRSLEHALIKPRIGPSDKFQTRHQSSGHPLPNAVRRESKLKPRRGRCFHAKTEVACT